jgi:3-isopropylmalate/(R)-2-methylmalate dehydratase small subunit
MEKFRTLTSHVVPLPARDIDTDQIIPARYLKLTGRQGFGEYLFADWRYHADGSPNPAFILNQPHVQGAKILLAGDNFGCGSSREHAPWALLGWGFRGVISTSFADIFHNNALNVGLLPVVVDIHTQADLFRYVERDPQVELTIDLPSQSLRLPNDSAVTFPIEAFAKRCLLEGIDQLDYLLSFSEKIEAFEAAYGSA